MKAPRTARKPTLSPTRISTYLECALKYRYIYIDKIGRFYMRARAGFSFGSTLHGVLQEFHAQGGVQSAQDLASGIDENWISAGYETRQQEQEHLEAGRQIVTAYHAAHQERAAAAVRTVATEKTITCDLGRFKLTGRVDRIDEHADGLLEIVDYKSGRLEVTPEEVKNSLAMSCYQLILSKLYPDNHIAATIYCLRSGSSATARMTSDEIGEFERDLIRLGDEMLDRDYLVLTPQPVEACAYCDFLPRCRRHWRQLEEMDSGEPDVAPHSEHGL